MAADGRNMPQGGDSFRFETLEPRRLLAAGDIIDSDGAPVDGSEPGSAMFPTSGGRLIVMSPSTGGNMWLYRINATGGGDTTFGNLGAVNTALVYAPAGNARTYTDPATGRFGLIYRHDIHALGVAMFDEDGSPDTSFGDDGRWRADLRLENVARQSDGKLVVAGTVSVSGGRVAVVRRLNADGTRDMTFGEAGEALLGPAAFVRDLAVTPDDRITVSAEDDPIDPFMSVGAQRLVRLSPDGMVDAAFGGGDGVIELESGGTEIEVAADGAIVQMIGSKIRRYHADGAVEWTLTDAVDLFDDGPGMLLDANGRILLYGSTTTPLSRSSILVRRYFPDGKIDRTYVQSPQPADFDGVINLATVQNGDELVTLGSESFHWPPGFTTMNRRAGGSGVRVSLGTKGTLAVEADDVSAEDDVIEVARRRTDGNVIVRARVDGGEWIGSFPPSRVKRIAIYTRAGDDRVTIFPGVKGSHVDGGPGHDTITGGDAGDLLVGGGGRDVMIGGFGDDRLFGNTAADTLFGGPGTDASDDDPLDTRDGIEEFL
jgi:uncharacterized delta-60 repeat protein